MIGKIIVLAVVIVLVVGVYYVTNRPHETGLPIAKGSWPSDLRMVNGQCVGHYNNGVAVSWPARNTTC